MSRIDSTLLALQEERNENIPENPEALFRELYGDTKRIDYVVNNDDPDGSHFVAAKTQFLSLLDKIIALNPDDFAVIKRFQENIAKNLQFNTTPADRAFILIFVKNTLEFAYRFIQACPKKMDRSSLNSYQVNACLPGAGQHIVTICSHFTNISLQEKLSQSKREVISALAVEFIGKHNLLLIPEYGQQIGNEVHFVHALFNAIAPQYGLKRIEDRVIPQALRIFNEFSSFVKSHLNYRLIVNHFISTHPAPIENVTYDVATTFLKSIGGDGSELYRLYALSDANEQTLYVKNPDLFTYQYQLLMYDLLRKNGWLSSLDILKIESRRLRNTLLFIRFHGQIGIFLDVGQPENPHPFPDIRLLTIRDKNVIAYHCEELLQFADNDLSLFPSALLPTFIDRLAQEFNLPLLKSLLQMVNGPYSDAESCDDKIAAILQEYFSNEANSSSFMKHIDILCALLLTAIQNNYCNTTTQLLSQTYPNQAILDSGETSLFIAAQCNRLTILKMILDIPGTDINRSRTTDDATPLLIAAAKGHLAIVNALLAKEDIDVNKADKDSTTPLLNAAQNGHVDVVNALLAKEGIEINKVHTSNNVTPLYVAAQNGHVDVVNALLAKEGIEINKALKSNNATPLFIAAHNGHVDVVNALLAKEGIEVNKALRFAGITPLFVAVLMGDVKIVRILVNHIKSNNQRSPAGNSDFFQHPKNQAIVEENIISPMRASRDILEKMMVGQGQKLAFEDLLRERKLGDQETIFSFSTLHLAIICGHIEIVTELEKALSPEKYDSEQCPITIAELKKLFFPKKDSSFQSVPQ